jgi:DNA-binding beta-propeller fold protein YncE
VTTDSRQRIIISDPDLSAIHILDPNGKATFRIEGGPRSRFQAPEAIAVDADDNIYVVDASKSAIIVFDPEGNYLRTIGTLSGESRFESLGALAIDRKSRIVYAVDPGADELLLFSLEGQLLDRMGGRSKDKLMFIHPSELALTENEIIVLDDFGSRVQVFDSQHNLLNSFRVRASDQPPLLSEVGLSSDSTGLIYLSNLFPDEVAVFNHSGKLVALFGHSGNRVEEFKVPSGIWIDGSDRIYIADTDNSRVQVFRTVVTEKIASNGAVTGDSR